MTFPKIKTFDSSATPTDGGPIQAPKGMAEIDLTEIRAAMADAVKEAEANDPKLLRAKIRELEKKSGTAIVQEKIVEVPVLKDGQLARAEKLAERMKEAADKLLAEAVELRRLIAPTAVPRPAPRALVRQPARPARAPTAPPSAPIEGISNSQQRILDSLAALEGMGIAQPSKEQLALWCEVSPTSGGYFNNLGALRSAGLIEYPSGGMVQLTDAGRKAAQQTDPLTVEEMQESLCRKVGLSKAAIIRALIDIYPESIGKEELAERIGVSPTSGGYFNNLGGLRTLGVIDYPAPGTVAAQPVLFLER